MTREILNGLRPETYEHIWDLNAKKVLKSVPLLDAAIKKLYEFFSDRVIMLEHKASYLELNSKTADRAGLLCVQDIEAASSGLSKLSGFLTFTDDNFNKEEFMSQAERFHEEFKEGTAAMLANVKIMLDDVTHPYTLSRVYELNNWYKTGQYTNVVNQFTRKLLDDNNTADTQNIKFKKCNFCGFENNILQAKFCSKCGAAFES